MDCAVESGSPKHSSAGLALQSAGLKVAVQSVLVVLSRRFVISSGAVCGVHNDSKQSTAERLCSRLWTGVPSLLSRVECKPCTNFFF